MGGIREIEFIAQVFQLIRGGRDPALQRRELQVVLPTLAGRGHLSQDDADRLMAAYRFLRQVENRLQMMEDQQTHALPTDAVRRTRLTFAMRYPGWEQFAGDLDRHRRYVHNEFSRTFAHPGSKPQAAQQTISPQVDNLTQGRLADQQALELLTSLGYDDPAHALSTLQTLRTGRAYQTQSTSSRERLDRLLPLLLTAAGNSDKPAQALARIMPLIEAVARRPVYLTLLAEQPVVLAELVELSGASPWIAEFLNRHPILLDELLDPRDLYAPPDRGGLAEQLAEEFRHLNPLDAETQMERLRQFKQIQVLRVAAADVMGALPLMRVSDQLTWIAEAILEHVLQVTWQQMTARYGQPMCQLDGQERQAEFAIVAYGKLGGIELGYGSDLDLVFLHGSAGERQFTDGKKPIDNSVFFVRLGQRIVHALTAFTAAGQLYEVDTRLRPSGSAGVLVSSLHGFDHYQRSNAWTWEHQALVRARPIAGGHDLAKGFQATRAAVLAKVRDSAVLQREVREMRERMWRELGNRDPRRFDLKRDPGGIADIEFMVQYIVLADARNHQSLSEFTDNIRILDAIAATGLLAASDVRFLQDAYRTFRNRVHSLSLQGEPAVVDAAAFAEEREGVRRLWRNLMEH
jgi:glutamate-ammonia-ligase adenylyltransferase